MADYQTGMSRGGGSFTPYAAGYKHYGGGRSMPNLGPVQDKLGYAQRDREAAAKRNLTLKKIQRGFGMKFQVL